MTSDPKTPDHSKERSALIALSDAIGLLVQEAKHHWNGRGQPLPLAEDPWPRLYGAPDVSYLAGQWRTLSRLIGDLERKSEAIFRSLANPCPDDRERVRRLRMAIGLLRAPHDEYCFTRGQGAQCTCGADFSNAAIDAVLKETDE